LVRNERQRNAFSQLFLSPDSRTFREALREVPKIRKGEPLRAPFTEVTEWGRKHPDAPKVSAGTVNKQLGAVQANLQLGVSAQTCA